MNKIKNFFADIILIVKNKFTSSKYIIKGKCRQCGNCCRSILFSNNRGYIKDSETFQNMQKKYVFYRNFSINGKVNGEGDELDGALLFKCRHLKGNRCGIYFFRPFFCRDYPAINKEFIRMGGVTLDGCGYYFDVDKKFSEYLK